MNIAIFLFIFFVLLVFNYYLVATDNKFAIIINTLCGLFLALSPFIFDNPLNDEKVLSNVNPIWFIWIAVVLIWIIFVIYLFILWKKRSERHIGSIIKCFENRDTFNEKGKEYTSFCKDLISKAKGTPEKKTIVRLMSTGGDGLVLRANPNLRGHQHIPKHFKKALNNNCEVQIILADPLSEQIAFKLKLEDLKYAGKDGKKRPHDYLVDKTKPIIDEIIEWDKGNLIQARFFKYFPTVNFVDNGNKSVISFQTIENKGLESPILIINNSGPIYRFFASHFDFVFDRKAVTKNALRNESYEEI